MVGTVGGEGGHRIPVRVEPSVAAARADRRWMALTAAALATIWAAVLVISLFAPDLVSGAEQEHVPVAAFATWLWGAISTGVVLWTMSRLRGDEAAQPIVLGYAVTVVVIWVVASVLALALPNFETGTDPTSLPFAALIAPVGATVMCGVAGVVAVVFSHPPSRR